MDHVKWILYVTSSKGQGWKGVAAAGGIALEDNQCPAPTNSNLVFGELLANACMLPAAAVGSIHQATIVVYKPVINIHNFVLLW